MTDARWRFDTAVIHGAQTPGEWKSATLAPIYQTASHRFDTAEELTGGIDAVVTGSGMAAINNAILAICQSGDEIVSGNSLFMSTFLKV